MKSLSRSLFCALVLLGTGALAQELQRPQALAGWEVSMGEQLRLVQLPAKEAPRLPAWTQHGDRHPRDPIASSDDLAESMKPALERAIHVVNAYLPEDMGGSFQLWIFKGVPYAAKTLNPQLVLSARVLSPENRERLPFVIAHEMHHLALMQTGFLKSHASARMGILSGLLTEGVATWLSFSSGLFPELEQTLREPQLTEAFEMVRSSLNRSADSRAHSEDLYQQNKWGYSVGCWMIERIEERFGREAWLVLLSKSADEAAQELVALYARTDPPAEYRLY